jgi:hypothetical protein
VKPSLGYDRRQVEFSDHGFRISLFDISKAAELTLNAVVEAMPVTIGADELSAGDEIAVLDPLDDMHRERQLRHPGVAVLAVLQIKFGGGLVLNLCLSLHVVRRVDEEVRLLPVHEIDIAHGPPRVRRERGGPDKAGRAIAQEVCRRDDGEAVYSREMRETMWRAPEIAGWLK